MGYARVAIKGFSWLTAFRVITRAISFGKTIVLARFINPSQFGSFGIVMLVLSFIEVITETGVNVFLIQEKNNVDKYINSAWVVSILRGIIIATVMIISSSFVAHFFNSPEAQQLIIIASIIPFLRGFINPSVVKFQKELKFQQEAYYRVSILIVEIIATVVLLFISPQTVSLIIGIIIGVVFELLLSFLVVAPRPRIEFNKDYLALIVNNGKWITGTVILNYGYERGDNILVGRMLSSYSLGIYDMAYRIAMVPLTEIGDMITRVVFPVYVLISDSYERFKRAFFRTLFVTCVLVFPIGAVFFFFTEQIVLFILGQKWIEVVPALQVLSILGVIKAVMNCALSMLLSVKMQKQITLITFIGVTGMFSTIVPLILQFGLLGAAYAATFGYLLTTPFVLYFCARAFQKVKHKEI